MNNTISIEKMNKTKEKKKAYNRLGFSKMDMTEVVTALNVLLANYQIHYQKLRKFHWNVEGEHFFKLHEFFEEEYNSVKINIDEVAERIRVFGRQPMGTLKEYLETATIAESKTKKTAYEMVQEIRSDFETLLSFMVDALTAADEVGDTATSDLMTRFIQRMEKRHWMMSAWSVK